MAAVATQPLHIPYQDLDGAPLENGKLYFGTENLNPETNPITVYWDAAMTQPAAQPVRTLNGVTVNTGRAAVIYAPTNYSLTVKDSTDRLIYSELTSSGSFFGYILTLATSAGSALIGFIQAGAGAVARTMQSKARERLTATDFGADDTGAVDCSAAIALVDAQGPFVFTKGTYKVSTNLTIASIVSFDNGATMSIDAGKTVTFAGGVFRAGRTSIGGAGTVVQTGRGGNTWFGLNALKNNTNGEYNTAFGVNALAAQVGNVAGPIQGQGNHAFGINALAANMTGNSNTAIGFDTLQANILGDNNTAIGWAALSLCNNDENVAVGNGALQNLSGAGKRNTAVGTYALKAAGTYLACTAVGFSALLNNTSTNSTAVGNSCLANNTSGVNTAVGAGTLSFVTVGTGNVAMGLNAGLAIVGGSANTLIGTNAGLAMTGDNNTLVGYRVGEGIIGGANNTVIGATAALASLTTGSNNTVIGYQAAPSAVGVSNEITLGNGAITSFRCQVALTVVSDARDKMREGKLSDLLSLDFLDSITPEYGKLKPRKSGWDVGGKGQPFFIAQDVLAAEQRAGIAGKTNIVNTENPEHLEMTYEKMIPVMWVMIQKLKAKITKLETGGV